MKMNRGTVPPFHLYRNIVRVVYPLILIALFYAVVHKRDFSFSQKEQACKGDTRYHMTLIDRTDSE